jgi:isoquinoline 1-oxidoreductase alpha subunit
MISLTVNGVPHRLEAEADMPLLWALRDRLGLTGTKYGCGIAQCGVCTVHLDGRPTKSCQIRLGEVGDAAVTTIEGVAGEVAQAVGAAWRKLDVVQCGYCQSGQIMTAIGLLSANRAPDDAAITAAMDANLCRCGTYQRIRAAVREAACALA